jgi:hypothetical protein
VIPEISVIVTNQKRNLQRMKIHQKRNYKRKRKEQKSELNSEETIKVMYKST